MDDSEGEEDKIWRWDKSWRIGGERREGGVEKRGGGEEVLGWRGLADGRRRRMGMLGVREEVILFLRSFSVFFLVCFCGGEGGWGQF